MIFWRRLNLNDRVILLVALNGLFAFLYLLYDDSILTNWSDKVDAPVIGKISRPRNDVRLKHPLGYEWKPVRRDSKLVEGDSLFTGSDSTAQVSLQDGSEFTITPNSMVVFNVHSNQMALDLQFGTFQGKIAQNSNLQVTVGHETISLDGSKGDSTVELTKGFGVELKVLQGEVEINSGNEKLKFQSPKVLSLSSNARDANGKKLSISEKAPGEGVKSMNDALAEAKAHNPGLAAKALDQEIRFITPADKAQVKIKADDNFKPLETTQIPVKWYPGELVREYELELSADPTFKQAVLVAQVAKPEWTTPPMNQGKYFLRVRAKSELQPPWAAPLEFTVVYQPPPLLPAPLTQSAPPEELTNPDVTKPLVYAWSSVPKASQYEIQFARDAEFKEMVKKQTLKDTRYELKDYALGDYYVRIRGVTPLGRGGEFGATIHTKMIVTSPLLNELAAVNILAPDAKAEPQPVPIALEWRPVPLAKKYEIEISDTKDFAKAQKLVTDSTRKEVLMKKPGKNFYRVRAIASDGSAMTPYSPAGTIEYIFRVPLATPTLIEPSNNVTLFFQKLKDNSFWMEWQPVRQAEIYTLEIATDKEFAKKVLSETTDKTRFFVKKAIPQGKLFWRVKAKNAQLESPWSETRPMIIYSGRKAAEGKE